MRLLEADAVAADGDTAGSAGLLDALHGDPELEDGAACACSRRGPGSTASPRSSPRAPRRR
jgi:hypothetical protein